MTTIVWLFLLVVLVAIVGGYGLARKALGTQAANRNLVYAIPWLLAGALLPLVLSPFGQHAFAILYGLYALGVLLWLASWPVRKKQAGELLIRVGTTLQNRIIFFFGLLQVGVAIAMTLNQLDLFTGGLVTTGGVISGIARLAFWWTLALLFLSIGQSNLELHEHGLTHLFAWQPWERIVAFGWDDDQPTTLILKAKPRTFLSRKYLTMSIPSAQVEEVDRLLENYLLESDLATEMDGEVASQV